MRYKVAKTLQFLVFYGRLLQGKVMTRYNNVYITTISPLRSLRCFRTHDSLIIDDNENQSINAAFIKIYLDSRSFKTMFKT